MTAIFNRLQQGIFGGPSPDYVPEDNIWAHYLQGIMIGFQRRTCASRKQQAGLCEEINRPTESLSIVGKHKMYDNKGRNLKCLKYHDIFVQCKCHAHVEIEQRCSDPWIEFQQALVAEDQKEAAKRGTAKEWYKAGIDMFLRIPVTRDEQSGPHYLPGVLPPPYVPAKPVGESLGDTLGAEASKKFRLLSVCMLSKDNFAYLRDGNLINKKVPPVSAYDAQNKMTEGRGGKKIMKEVLMELRDEKAKALAKGEHWGKRDYKTWDDVKAHPVGYTREIFERRRLVNKEVSELDP